MQRNLFFKLQIVKILLLNTMITFLLISMNHIFIQKDSFRKGQA